MDDNNKPHTGDVYNISVTVGYAESVNPSAKVVNIYQGERAARGARQQGQGQDQGQEELDKIALREKIMAYVGKLDGFATAKWAERIEPLWETILALPDVSAEVYNHGKQKCAFNRNLIARMVRLLREGGVYKVDSDKAYAIALEDDHETPVRGQLAFVPENPKIVNAVNRAIGKKG